jgi:hypothetical protein
MSHHEDGICVVELRDTDGTVIQVEEPEFSENTGRKLHKIAAAAAAKNNSQNQQQLLLGHEIIAADFVGNILKTKF